MSQWEIDKARADPHTKRMIRFASYSWSELLLCASTLEVDRLGFDIVNTLHKVRIGCRVLFTEIDTEGRFYDATIRWARKSGAPTERR